ncbi:MAG: CRISPR-associated helicase Cas3' [Spirochaetota bacterium]
MDDFFNQFYAKSNGESIKEHTEKLIKAFDDLQSYIILGEKEKEILKLIIKTHDKGKINPEFQNRMRKKIGRSDLLTWKSGNIPHEWLSPAFISEHEEEDIKTWLKELDLDADRFFRFILFVIICHHNREGQTANDDLLKKVISWLNDNYKLGLEYYYNVNNIINTFNSLNVDRNIWRETFPYRIKWLGTLLKCDYTASAGIPPEQKYDGDFNADLQNWLKKNNMNLKQFQVQAKNNSDKNIILIASTGMGKTEAAMSWINGKKAFYLLGIRVAVNEMYKRFEKIFGGKNIALLHGESSYFFAQNELNDDDFELKIEKIRKLSYPITIATADQLVTSVFKYPGFELTYLTSSYSKIVVDEIQSFSPAAIASIVVFLKEIHNLGGKFMLMTATLPPFLIDEFKDLDNVEFFKPQLLTMKRHRIKIVDDEIENVNKYVEKFKNKKLLIICNTVSKAQKIYEILKNFNPNLIHSKFIGKDRKEKEKLIMEMQSPCIWITTQIVEASLDIDYDLLFTECAPIESLLQRFGRCYRKREYNLGDTPNIYIFKGKPSNIYDKYLFNKTWEELKNFDKKLLTEADKQHLINKIFENISNNPYYQKYQSKKEILEIGYRSLSRFEAELDFREITNNYVIIPKPVFEENKKHIIETLNFIDDTKNNRLERLKKQAEIMEYTIPLKIFYNMRQNLSQIESSLFCKRHNIKILDDVEYDNNFGLTGKAIEIEESEEPINII